MEFFGIDLVSLVETAGYVGLFAIVFAESGLFFGFFFPGDSLLFTAGFVASFGVLNIWILLPLLFVAAVLGDNIGYRFGKVVGPRIFNRDDSWFFHKEHIKRAEKFFEKYGKKTIVLARFVPVVRTFAPIVAGMGSMRWRTFLIYNLVGGLIWAVGITLLGYFFGTLIPNPEKYLLPVIAVIIVASFVPPLLEWLRHRRKGPTGDKELA